MRFGLPVNSRFVSLALVRLVVSCRRTAEGLRRGAASAERVGGVGEDEEDDHGDGAATAAASSGSGSRSLLDMGFVSRKKVARRGAKESEAARKNGEAKAKVSVRCEGTANGAEMRPRSGPSLGVSARARPGVSARTSPYK